VLNYDAENYHLANDEWKSDIIPEIMDGKNVADFIDPDIAEMLGLRAFTKTTKTW